MGAHETARVHRCVVAALGTRAARPRAAHRCVDAIHQGRSRGSTTCRCISRGAQTVGLDRGSQYPERVSLVCGDADRARSSARELVGLNPDLILVGAAPGLVALRREARAVPLVFVAVTDPVGLGLVESLARPGGNATGFTFFEFSVGTKLLESLQQIAPQVRRIAIMYSPNSPVQNQYLKPIDAIGPSIAMTLIRKPIRDASEIEAAIEAT